MLQLSEVTDTGEVYFKSNLFGSLGAGLFVGPNMIDFGTVFKDFDKKLLDNIAVVCTLVGILLIYIPCLLACRRLDKLDTAKVCYLPTSLAILFLCLSLRNYNLWTTTCTTKDYAMLQWQSIALLDNPEDGQYQYELHVYTGMHRLAATQSKVFIEVKGSLASSGVRAMTDGTDIVSYLQFALEPAMLQ